MRPCLFNGFHFILSVFGLKLQRPGCANIALRRRFRLPVKILFFPLRRAGLGLIVVLLLFALVPCAICLPLPSETDLHILNDIRRLRHLFYPRIHKLIFLVWAKLHHQPLADKPEFFNPSD